MRPAIALAVLLSACGDVLAAPGDAAPADGGLVDRGAAGDGAGPDAGELDAGMMIAPPVADVLLRDNDAGVENLNLEVSPDMRWATLNERDQRTLRVRPRLFRVDDDGELVERCAYPELDVRANSSFQFGEANGLPFAVALDRSTPTLLVLRPTVGEDCADHLTRHPLRGLSAANDELLNPYPRRGGDGAAWVAVLRHSAAENTETVYVQDVFAETDAQLAWRGTRPDPRRAFATFASVPRWLPGRATFLAGRWDGGVIEAHETVLGEATQNAFVTDDGRAKPDLSPFVTGGVPHLFTNDEGGADGVVYRRAEDGIYRRRLTIPFDASQSTIAGRPAGAVSFEAFTWEGELYASYQVADAEEAAAGCRGVNCRYHELWMAAFARDPDGTLRGVRHACRVSAAPEGVFRGKVDPEAVVAGARLRIYYHRSDLTRMPSRPGNQLAVLRLDDRERFDEACAAGAAAP